jgi:hypothetical protein
MGPSCAPVTQTPHAAVAIAEGLSGSCPGGGAYVSYCLSLTGTLGDTRVGVPRLLQWPVVDDGDAFTIKDLACLW